MGENIFKIRAYQRASRLLESYTDEDLTELIENRTLLEQKGIGKNIFSHIRDIYSSGSFKELDELNAKVPAGLHEMLKIPGLGPKKIQAIYKNLGITDIESLKKSAQDGSLTKIQGFRAKTVENILKGIRTVNLYKGLIRYDIALLQAQEIRDHIMSVTRSNAFIAGSLRRFKELVHDIDLVMHHKDPDLIYELLSGSDFVADIPQKGPTKISLLTNTGMQCDIRIVKEDEIYSALHYLTGSKEHNTKMRAIAKDGGLKLNEYGIFREDGSRIPLSSEADIFYKLGMKQYIPPELREDMGEIEAAMQNKLPELIEQEDIKGIFHCHTNMSDGELSPERIAEIGTEMDLEYIGIADHSASAYYAGGLTIDDVKKQWQLIDNINSSQNKIKLLKGIESDILPDGNLDYPDGMLEQFDFVIGSVHTGFKMTMEHMTKRILKALRNPYLHILGHPSGRLIQKREPYAIDMMKIIKTAVKYNKLIEINAHPQRMDLDWFYLKKGIQLGLRTVISLDIHGIDDFQNIPIGIMIARKAWASPSDIINTMSYEDIKRMFL